MKTHKSILHLLTLFLILFFLFTPIEIYIQLNDNIRVVEGEHQYLNLHFPFSLYVKADRDGVIHLNGAPVRSEEFNKLTYNDDLYLRGVNEGDVNLQLSLFNGLIPIRQLNINVLPEIELIPGGHSIGIKVHNKGVLVADIYSLERMDGEEFSPAENAGIETGDILLGINNKEFKDVDDAAEKIKKESRKGPVVITVERSGKIKEFTVTPYLCPFSEEYRIGLYIRDTTAGVGTLTFYHQESGIYGALGHVITELDSNEPLTINNGLIVTADVVDIKTAQEGQPGEKGGIFRNNEDILGTIKKNNSYGIFGRIKNLEQKEFITPLPANIPLGLASQVETGPAEILTVIEGKKIQSFNVEIEEVNLQNTPSSKGMIIRVVDEDLLEATGGIVQGMSGSPIIQNGRLIGAVTHVFINDPRRGYGIFAEWMVKETDILSFY